MERFFLAPLGRAEPDDMQGWMEQGGCLALQRALAMDGAALREALNGAKRRDGQGILSLEAGQPACVVLPLGPMAHPARLLVEELPAWLLEGAILLARACEQHRAILYLEQAQLSHRRLLEQVITSLTTLGVLGEAGWGGGVTVESRQSSPPLEVLDAVTTQLLPLLLWRRRDPGTTLLAVRGAVTAPAIYEIPLGLSTRQLVYQWAGGVTTTHPLFTLGEQRVEGKELSIPLHFDHFGTALGSGHLTVSER
ncbi:MAG: hypothetical protein H0T73_20135 [Ardenticatenales bacterium]|nr:hypothetical protein [Ardenticatenales bacterium]